MTLSRARLAPISYLSGRFGTPTGPRADRQLSALALSSREVVLPDAALTVSGHAYPGQTLDAHLWTDGRQALAFCGDLYNLRELERLAAAVAPRTRPDNAAHLLAILLESCPERLLAQANGKFVIARTGPWGLELIRDRIGEEQLYHATTRDGGVVFSSSLRGLVAVLPEAELYVPDSVKVFETPVGAETMFRGVSKLEGGTRLTVRPDGRHRTEEYWRIEPREPDARGDEELAEELRALLHTALRARLPASGEPSAFLSGGQDSSWVSCALDAIGHRPRSVYTTAFRELDSVYDESPHARRVADHIGAEHVVLEPEAEDFVKHFPTTMAIFDEVKANAAHFTEYWIAREAAARGERVLFSGYGADEALGGEVRYLVMYLDREREASAPLFRRHPMLVNYEPLFAKLGQYPAATPEWEKYYGLMRRGTPDRDEDRYRELVRREFDRSGRLVDQMGLADIAISAPPLLDTAKVDKYWGVDKVCPFLDPRVVSFAFSLPEHLKIQGFTTKALLRTASRGLVPDEITHRTDKVGFAFPHNDPRYAAFIGRLAESWAVRTGRRVDVDPVRGRYDRTILMAASQELVHQSYDTAPEALAEV
ncbi:asparagine synthase-related protein [Streptomyces sp. NPDC046985]|uniref:asparagine synthetase B family protein n=1 Tax=Streptomyces sp. NPDC046985 TaxID=3155377 RepID=UPI0033E98A79